MEFKDIEKKLRNGKLPDQDMSGRFGKIWKNILDEKRSHRKSLMPFFIPPWAWALASIVVILLFIILIFMIKTN